ncbi:hypothetical protein SLEP1_g41256 [Rubroshorea leprosula]|uniref:Uncharacterized protein n=1 Tax=Rubroshorea leprosula TaxID=152421 RepID=A0AAV5L6V8_9ROSI|nr:hypothetical protein SLEP1_g41256 [Rubroshorea leprosula]
MTLEQPLRAQLYSVLRSSDSNGILFNLPMWKVRQVSDVDAETRSGGGCRWVVRLSDLGSPACTATDRSCRMKGTTARSVNKSKSAST